MTNAMVMQAMRDSNEVVKLIVAESGLVSAYRDSVWRLIGRQSVHAVEEVLDEQRTVKERVDELEAALHGPGCVACCVLRVVRCARLSPHARSGRGSGFGAGARAGPPHIAGRARACGRLCCYCCLPSLTASGASVSALGSLCSSSFW